MAGALNLALSSVTILPLGSIASFGVTFFIGIGWDITCLLGRVTWVQTITRVVVRIVNIIMKTTRYMDADLLGILRNDFSSSIAVLKYCLV